MNSSQKKNSITSLDEYDRLSDLYREACRTHPIGRHRRGMERDTLHRDERTETLWQSAKQPRGIPKITQTVAHGV